MQGRDARRRAGYDAPVRAWLLALHLLGVILWMGGVFALGRLLADHARELPSVRPRYVWLEGRMSAWAALGALLTLGCGGALVGLYGLGWLRAAAWMRYKLVLVGAVAGIHVRLAVRRRRIARQAPDAPVPRTRFALLPGALGLLLFVILLLSIRR
jgi:uncharacterized membrane protein